MPCEDLVIDLYLEARHEVVSLYIVERGKRVTVTTALRSISAWSDI